MARQKDKVAGKISSVNLLDDFALIRIDTYRRDSTQEKLKMASCEA
jgi:hypothetical protein